MSARAADYEVVRVPHAVARDFVSRHHYAKSAANTSLAAFALLRRCDSTMVGAALWMHPTRPVVPWARSWAKAHVEQLAEAARARAAPPQRIAKIEGQARGLDGAGVLTLSRLVLLDTEPKNAESVFLGAMLRALEVEGRFRILVTYADEGLRGHTGTIYRATNWIYAPSLHRSHARWMDDEGRLVSIKSGSRGSQKGNRTASEMRTLGYTRVVGGVVHRYVQLLPPPR